jgi:hypothetical protein
MAITAALITTGASGTNGTVFTPASATYVNNRLYLLAIGSYRPSAGASFPPDTVTGGGLTWAKLGDTIISTSGTSTRSISVWWALTTSGATTGALTITYGSTSNNCTWSVVEFDGVDTTAPVVQTVTNKGDSGTASVTLAAYGSANNRPYSAQFKAATAVFTAEHTELHQQNLDDGTNDVTLQTQWSATVADTTPSATLSSNTWGIIGIEIKAAVAGTAVKDMIGSGMIPFAR